MRSRIAEGAGDCGAWFHNPALAGVTQIALAVIVARVAAIAAFCVCHLSVSFAAFIIHNAVSPLMPFGTCIIVNSG